eukprot:1999399-Rhodomonas_salina.2
MTAKSNTLDLPFIRICAVSQTFCSVPQGRKGVGVDFVSDMRPRATGSTSSGTEQTTKGPRANTARSNSDGGDTFRTTAFRLLPSQRTRGTEEEVHRTPVLRYE